MSRQSRAPYPPSPSSTLTATRPRNRAPALAVSPLSRRWRSLLAFGTSFSIVLGAGVARADPAPTTTSSPTPAAATTPPATTTPTTTSAAPGTSAASGTNATATGQDVEKARAHFQQGVQFYNNGDYKLSLIEFRRSYELSQNYRILYNIGQVNQQLGNYTKALAALEQYLKDGGGELVDDRRDEVIATVAALHKRVAHIRLVTNIDAPEILIDGFPAHANSESGAITVDPGDHRVDVNKAGYQATGSIVTLAAGDNTELKLTLRKVPPQNVMSAHPAPAPSRDTTALWIGWSTTGAAAIGAAVTGVLASMQASELADLRNSTSTQGERDKVGQRAHAFALASDILSGTALVAGGISLYLTLRPHGHATEKKPPAAATSVALGPTSVWLKQSF